MNIYFLGIPEVMISHPGISVMKEEADEIVSYLLKNNLVEKKLKIHQNGNYVCIPVRAQPGYLIGNMEVARYDFSTRINGRKPYEEILGILEKSGVNGSSVPKRWITYGDSVILKFLDNTEQIKSIAKAFMEVLKCKSVYEMKGGVRGRNRIPRVKLVAGKGGETRHLENGVIYVFDPERIMYSPGNVNERHHFLRLIRGGDTVIDMFAGIGYFSLQIARHTDAARVYCMDINPEAIRFLEKSASVNGLSQYVEAMVGDCRVTKPELRGDLVFMGNFSSIDYIIHGIQRLRSGGGIIAHFLVSSEEIDTYSDRINYMIRRLGRRSSVEDLHRVKSYAPNLWHMSAYIHITG